MDFGILQALKGLKEHRYIQYVGVGLASLVESTDGSIKAVGVRRSRMQLTRLSAAVCGIELCYAAETAFVTPILLKLGVPIAFLTMVWCISPILGFFLCPLLGSLSDRCSLKLGRRRPFILLMSAGILLGLVFVPNGETAGRILGDPGEKILSANTSARSSNASWAPSSQINLTNSSAGVFDPRNGNSSVGGSGELSEESEGRTRPPNWSSLLTREHVRGIIITIVGVAMLDFNCDACQSPCRAYLLDVTPPEDHSAGLTTFTVMAGLGGSVGYLMGGVDWNSTTFGAAFGGHIRVVFTMVTLFFILCLVSTMTSFRETPLSELAIAAESLQRSKKKVGKSKYKKFTNEDDDDYDDDGDDYGGVESGGRYEKESVDEKAQIGANGDVTYGTIEPPRFDRPSPAFRIAEEHDNTNNRLAVEKFANGDINSKIDGERIGMTVPKKADAAGNCEDALQVSVDVTLKTYLLSIVRMPRSMLVLCLTNLFCWMSLVCYSLYFTDFVGQAVFGGDPQAPAGSELHDRYDEGVRLGSMAMSLYSLACAIYSLCIDKLIRKFRAKPVYVCGQLAYTVGMVILAFSKHKVAVILLSPSAGIMYATLFTMPYLLVAHYHTTGTFDQGADGVQVRGLGTDVALVGSMVFLAQFLLSVVMGSLVHAAGSTVAVVVAAAILSFLGAVTATQVTYLDL